MTFKIDYAHLEMAMSNQNTYDVQAYMNTTTGEVFFNTEYEKEQALQFSTFFDIEEPAYRLSWAALWLDGDIDIEFSAEETEKITEAVETYWKQFVKIPTVPSYESYNDMVDFTETVTNRPLYNLLSVALDGKGAFRRFKDVLLSYPRERQQWFDFKAECWRKRIDEWLEELREEMD